MGLFDRGKKADAFQQEATGGLSIEDIRKKAAQFSAQNPDQGGASSFETTVVQRQMEVVKPKRPERESRSEHMANVQLSNTVKNKM